MGLVLLTLPFMAAAEKIQDRFFDKAKDKGAALFEFALIALILAILAYGSVGFLIFKAWQFYHGGA